MVTDKRRGESDRRAGAVLDSWHLDKRVPVALIVTMVLQLGGFVYYFGKLEERVVALERGALHLQLVPERLATLEERSKATLDTVQQIARQLGGQR